MPSTSGLVGAAGEYYVAAELSRRDWLATVTIKNSPGTDVLAQRLDRRRIVAIQTKTASPGSHFRLNVKDEAPGERDNEGYVRVSLRGDDERSAAVDDRWAPLRRLAEAAGKPPKDEN